MRGCLRVALASAIISGSIATAAGAVANGPPEVAFSRIVHGWTNYSTAFNVTHDTGTTGGYATIGTLYTPLADVTPLDFAAIVIWSGARTPNFANFEFRVFAWSSLDAFILEPREGDVANWSFAAPTGGSTSVPDATTRGGRPAYELRFSLTNTPVTFSNGHTYVVGFAVQTDAQKFGELYVPTAANDGPSDLQAGDLVAGGWQYLVNAGGSTVYSGELAVELIVAPIINLPRMEIARSGNFIRISWPVSAQDFVLEQSVNLPPNADWLRVDMEPSEENGMLQVVLEAPFDRRWFRLRLPSPAQP